MLSGTALHMCMIPAKVDHPGGVAWRFKLGLCVYGPRFFASVLCCVVLCRAVVQKRVLGPRHPNPDSSPGHAPSSLS